ncbi:CDGSH iron-sulfur domain-containing protein [Anaerotardibacter muris]|uniref:CDGSH iron-sulfur domain-containing protein n=1 Tax=Anaerotardibacter muris TaxID=2941505 RepID=UPI00203FD7F7|nr:CDGSH iron-sulfur domain-containing protein [Anaerotardibacter muris]
MTKQRIVITDGAYVVEGGIPLYQNAVGKSEDELCLEHRRMRQIPTGKGDYLLCRCGRSKTMPFCDYRHMTESPKFEGPETASRASYRERAQVYEGNGLKMYDDGRCAFVRLCHYDNKSVWNMSGTFDGEMKQEQINAAWHCPSGRLVVEDAETGVVYEPEYEPSIIVLEDVGLNCSGPLFVRGGVELVGQDGFVYETQNRYALCRCGKSMNKPFCDAMHHHEEAFDDGAIFHDGCVPSREEWRSGADSAGKLDESFKKNARDV